MPEMMEISQLVLRFLFAALFLYTAYTKLKDVNDFEEKLYDAPLVPASFAQFIVWGVIILEVVLAVLLLMGIFEILTAYFTLGIFIVFTFYIAVLLIKKETRECGCGGIFDKMSLPLHLVLNLLLTGLSFFYLQIII